MNQHLYLMMAIASVAVAGVIALFIELHLLKSVREKTQRLSNRRAEMICTQMEEISALRAERDELKQRIQRARSWMVCIGGPLNDNYLQFNAEQRKTFHNIDRELGGV